MFLLGDNLICPIKSLEQSRFTGIDIKVYVNIYECLHNCKRQCKVFQDFVYSHFENIDNLEKEFKNKTIKNINNNLNYCILKKNYMKRKYCNAKHRYCKYNSICPIFNQTNFKKFHLMEVRMKVYLVKSKAEILILSIEELQEYLNNNKSKDIEIYELGKYKFVIDYEFVPYSQLDDKKQRINKLLDQFKEVNIFTDSGEFTNLKDWYKNASEGEAVIIGEQLVSVKTVKKVRLESIPKIDNKNMESTPETKKKVRRTKTKDKEQKDTIVETTTKKRRGRPRKIKKEE